MRLNAIREIDRMRIAEMVLLVAERSLREREDDAF